MNVSLVDKKEALLIKLKEQGITDEKVLKVIADIPREDFIPDFLRAQAYENAALPIENEQTISQPYIVAYMTQELQVNNSHKVLEIGTGSGYQAAFSQNYANAFSQLNVICRSLRGRKKCLRSLDFIILRRFLVTE